MNWNPSYLLLWSSWLALLLASFVAGFSSEYWWKHARLDLRMASCLILAFTAWRFWWSAQKGASSFSSFLVAVGMTLGFYGDSHVGTRFWWPPVPSPIVGGILFFGLGHLAYMAASVRVAFSRALRMNGSWWLAILAWQIAGLAGWACIALSSDKEIGLRIPTLAYTLLVAGTPGFAFAVAFGLRGLWMWALGSALFFASDLLLAWQLFHSAFLFIDELTWICYGFGQMMIVFGSSLFQPDKLDPKGSAEDGVRF